MLSKETELLEEAERSLENLLLLIANGKLVPNTMSIAVDDTVLKARKTLVDIRMHIFK